jgi:glycerophosphoryl diester phosphodiesterase
VPNIKITVAGKIATNTTPAVVIVCGNKDYTVAFDLDDEWAAETARTARFVYYKNGQRLFKDVPFTGNTAAVPALSDIDYVMVGIYAGDLHTTTPAKVLCDRSILCGDQLEDLTPAQKAMLQAQIGDLSKLATAAKSDLVAAINEVRKNAAGEITDEQLAQAVAVYLDAHPVTPGATPEQAAQIEANTKAIKQLQQTGGGNSDQTGYVKSNFIPAKTRISAHRGDMETYPENTIPAFRSAGEKGAWGIETDVRLTSDGHLVCIHNATVDACTDGTGNVANFTLEELRALNIDYGEAYGNYTGEKLEIPLFSDYLAICREFGCVALVHLQQLGGEYVQTVHDAVKAAGMLNSAVFQSWGLSEMQTVRGIDPNAMVCTAYNSVTKTEVDAALAMGGPVAVHCNSQGGITTEVMNYAHENGVFIFSGFGVTNAPVDALEYWTNLGVDVITSTYLSHSQLTDLPNHSESDTGKVLVIGADGKPAWKTVQSGDASGDASEAKVPVTDWVMKTINDGTEWDRTDRITSGYVQFDSETARIVPASGYWYSVHTYDANKTWLAQDADWRTTESVLEVTEGYFYRFCMRRSDNGAMTTDDGVNLTVYGAASEPPSNGEGDTSAAVSTKWELLNDITVSEVVDSVEVNTDLTGKAIATKHMLVHMYLPAYELDGTTGTGYSTYAVNGKSISTGNSYCFPSAKWENAYFLFDIMACGDIVYVRCYRETNGTTLASGKTVEVFHFAINENPGMYENITSFKWSLFNRKVLPGSTFKIYGEVA